MSQENVDLVKAILRAAQTDWEWVNSVLDAEVRLDQSRFPDGGIYRGRAAFGDFYRRLFGTWDDLRITPERCGIMMRAASRAQKKTPERLTAMIRFHCSSVTPVRGPR